MNRILLSLISWSIAFTSLAQVSQTVPSNLVNEPLLNHGQQEYLKIKNEMEELNERVKPNPMHLKNSGINKMALDSIVEKNTTVSGLPENYTRHAFEYDYHGNVIRQYSIAKTAIGGLDTFQVYKYDYNTYGYLEKEEFYGYDMETQGYGLVKIEYSYNANLLLEEQLNSFKDTSVVSGNWETRWKRVVAYNSNGDFTGVQYFNYSSVLNSFVLRSSIRMGYDSNNNLIGYSAVSMVNGALQETDKYEQTWNTDNTLSEIVSWYNLGNPITLNPKGKFQYFYVNGLVDNTISYGRDTINHTWFVREVSNYTYDSGNLVDFLRESYSDGVLTHSYNQQKAYNPNDLLISETNWVKNLPDTTWVGVAHGLGKKEFEYDSDGNISRELSYEWDTTNLQYFNKWKVDYVNDASTSSEFTIYSELNTMNSTWSVQVAFRQEYDFSEPSDQLVFPMGYDMDYMQLSQAHGAGNGTPTGILINRIFDYHWSPTVVSSTNSIQPMKVKTFPNPVSDVWNVELGSINKGLLKIYDITGKIILEQYIDGSHQIETSSYKKGIYIYTVQVGDEIMNGKLIKD